MSGESDTGPVDDTAGASSTASNNATIPGNTDNATSGHSKQPSLPDREWEKSPIYLALSSRLSKTESTLESLSSQVNLLSTLVQSALAGQAPNGAVSQRNGPGGSRLNHGATPSASMQAVFSPFEEPDPQPSPFIPSARSTQPSQGSRELGQDANVAALQQQIAALSTSVAQLQRLQQSQAQLTRQSSAGSVTPGLPQSQQQSQGQQHGSSRLGGYNPATPFNRTIQHPSEYANGPLTTPTTGSGMGIMGMTSPNPSAALTGRPGVHRSASASVKAGDGEGGRDKWGHHSKFALQSGGQRDWSPGPGQGAQGGAGVQGGGTSGTMTPGGVSQAGVMTPGGGAAAPGAGIVVTKWDHLNLKVELLRSIGKYGIGPPNKIQARVLPFMLKGADIIAQAPPTQERIISYVVPALQLCLTLPPASGTYKGPAVIIITTTVDQATQCHKLVRNIGGPLGVRSALAAGTAGSSALQSEIATIQRDAVHLLIGTPAKIAEVLAPRGGLGSSECRLLILDEVDQLIARNLYEHVLNVSKLLPMPRRQGGAMGPLTPGGGLAPIGPPAPFSPGGGLNNAPVNVTSPYDAGRDSPFNPQSKIPFPGQPSQPSQPSGPSRFGAPGAPPPSTPGPSGGIERQTCIFSNTIPTDVINFSQSLQVRDPVRVLVRREGGVNSQESVSSVTPGVHLKHTYVYLTITGSARVEPSTPGVDLGPGTIGSERGSSVSGQVNSQNEEAQRAKEYKLDMLVKILEDYPLWQAVIYVGSFSALEAVVYKLGSVQWETLYLSPDMPPTQKKGVLQQWRLSLAGNGPRFLVIFDVNVKPPEIPWAPLVINFDLPRSVEGYALRAAAAVPPNRQGVAPNVNGVIVSFVQAAGGDVEMLRSTECAYRFKSAEIPSVFHDLFQH